MNEINIREMRKEETPLFVKWLCAHKETNKVSEEDLEILRKNQAKILVAEDETGILNFIPIRVVYEYGALAPKPGLSDITQTRIVLKMQDYMLSECQKHNIPGVLLSPNDQRFEKCLKKLGWTEVTSKTLKLNANQ